MTLLLQLERPKIGQRWMYSHWASASQNFVCCKVSRHISLNRLVWPGRSSNSRHKSHRTWNASPIQNLQALCCVFGKMCNLTHHLTLSFTPVLWPRAAAEPFWTNWPSIWLFCSGTLGQILQELWGIASGPENLFWTAGLLGLWGLEVNESRPNLASAALWAARNQSETPSLFRPLWTQRSAPGAAAFRAAQRSCKNWNWFWQLKCATKTPESWLPVEEEDVPTK